MAFLDLEYSKIKEITQSINGQNYYGIRIIKNKNYEDILSDNETLAKKWFDLFKRFCILSQFGLNYENVKVLGQGNFAKVFLVKRKSDQKLFATKVFDKKAIVSDEMEKVGERLNSEMSYVRGEYTAHVGPPQLHEVGRVVRRTELCLLCDRSLSRG